MFLEELQQDTKNTKVTEVVAEVIDRIGELNKYKYKFANFPYEISALTHLQLYMVHRFLIIVSSKKLYLNLRNLENQKKENIDTKLYRLYYYWINSSDVTEKIFGLKSHGLFFNRTF